MTKSCSILGVALVGVLVVLSNSACADRLVFPKSYAPNGSIDVVYQLDRPASGRGALDIEWTDAARRIVERRHIPVVLSGGSQLAFPLDLDRAVTAENKLVAHLSLDHGTIAGEADALFIVPPAGDAWSDYQIIMWQPQTSAGY